jgi:hypothetical protein
VLFSVECLCLPGSVCKLFAELASGLQLIWHKPVSDSKCGPLNLAGHKSPWLALKHSYFYSNVLTLKI